MPRIILYRIFICGYEAFEMPTQDFYELQFLSWQIGHEPWGLTSNGTKRCSKEAKIK